MSESNEPVAAHESETSETGAEQVIEDLVQMAQVPLEQLEELTTALNAEGGFLGGDRLQAFVQGKVSTKRQAIAIARVLENFQPLNTPNVLRYLQEWRSESSINAVRVSDAIYGAISSKLPKLVQSYPAIQRYSKARILNSATGNTAQSIHLFCDLRPVFDEGRERIEGYIPLTILRLSYKEQSGDTKEVEIHLTKSWLDILRKEFEKAEKKHEVLQRSVVHCLPHDFF